MRAALYIRVSTDAQFEEGYSADAQLKMLEAHCVSRGIAHYEAYVDGGYSGSNLDRPQMQRLIADAKAHRIDCVVVYKLDRLSRSQKDTLYLIEDVFLPHNVDFVSIRETLDTSSPYGRAMIGILSAFAQLERENIRERTRMGMKERVRNGLWMGGGRVPFGYDYDPAQGILVPNADAATVRRIYDLYLQGYSPARIAQMTGLKYERLATQILMRKSNAGFIRYNGVDYPGKHTPIVSLETYEKAMDAMRRRAARRLTTSSHLLTGLLECGVCGAKMRYQRWGKNGDKIWCYSQDRNKPHLVKDPNCDNDKVWAKDVEHAVISNLLRLSLRIRAEKPREKSADALSLLAGQLEACQKRLKRLYTLYSDADDDALKSAIDEQKAHREQLLRQIADERARGAVSERLRRTRQTIERLADIWDDLSQKERQNILRRCVEKVVVTHGNVEVYYRLDET